MPQFNYLATDAQNKQIKGSLPAVDLLEANTKLRQQGLDIIWVKQEARSIEKISFCRVSAMDLAVFAHQFAVMISSGIPLIRALKALAEEATNTKLKGIVDKVRFDVENGESLSGALAKYPDVFSNFFVNLVRSGEASGTLPKILDRLAKHLEKSEDLRRKVVSSFSYPAIVAVVAVAVVTFLLIFIVPVFSKVYKTIKVPLPGPTVALIAVSNIFIKFWWLILIGIGLFIYAWIMSKKNESFGLFFDKLALRLPVFGQLNRKVAVSRFVRTLSTMVESGVTLSASLVITRDVVGNRAIVKSVEYIQKDINQGKSLSDSLKAQGFFPPIATQMVSVGEESGALNAMMDKCADFLDEDIDTIIKSLVVKLEPALTIILAALVAFIALAIYLPMFDLIRQISR